MDSAREPVPESVALDGDSEMKRSNGLAALAGGWNEDDLEQFEEATAWCRKIDDEMWQRD